MKFKKTNNDHFASCKKSLQAGSDYTILSKTVTGDKPSRAKKPIKKLSKNKKNI